MGAVEYQGKEEGESAKVPIANPLRLVPQTGIRHGVHVALRVELASLDLHSIAADRAMVVGAQVCSLGKLTLDPVDAVDRVDKEDKDEDEGNLRRHHELTVRHVIAEPRGGERTFIPYWSFAITGLFERNSNVFFLQVKGKGNTSSKKTDISSTRSANTCNCGLHQKICFVSCLHKNAPPPADLHVGHSRCGLGRRERTYEGVVERDRKSVV